MIRYLILFLFLSSCSRYTKITFDYRDNFHKTPVWHKIFISSDTITGIYITYHKPVAEWPDANHFFIKVWKYPLDTTVVTTKDTSCCDEIMWGNIDNCEKCDFTRIQIFITN